MHNGENLTYILFAKKDQHTVWQIFSSLLMFYCFNTLFGILSYSETVPQHFTLPPHLTSPPPHLPPTSPPPHNQAIYTLIIYVFFGWERLSHRYRKRNIPQQNGIALTPLRATYKVGSRSPNMTGSKQHLVDEEGEVRKSHDSHMTFNACTYLHTP